MRASSQSSEIFSKFPIKLAQILDYFCAKCCFETLSFSKNCVTIVTHINLPVSFFFSFFGSLIYSGSPSQKFNSPWIEPFTLLRNAALSMYLSV